MEEKIISVAIDGPAAAGKSTVAKKVAQILGFTYIDTGAMYRAVTHAVIAKGLDPKSEEQSVTLLPGMTIDLAWKMAGPLQWRRCDQSHPRAPWFLAMSAISPR
jgi:cytidylate kinase